jgi:hypothetical protein
MACSCTFSRLISPYFRSTCRGSRRSRANSDADQVGACDAGDGHGHIGGGTEKRTFSHCHGYFPADRTLCLQKPRIDAKRFDLARFRIGDEASVQVLGGAGRLRQHGRKLARRARLSRDDREVSLARCRKGAFGELSKVVGGYQGEVSIRPSIRERHF